MALNPCRECGAQISTSAKKCPQCGAPVPRRRSITTWILGGTVALIVGSCIGKSWEADAPATASTPVSAPAAAKHEPSIAPHAVSRYTKKSHPKLYAAWGAPWVDKINTAMPKAASKVAASPSCDQVDNVDLSQDRSRPRELAVFFVDCRNGERFYVSEADLAASGPAVSVRAQTPPLDGQALTRCQEAVKAQLTNPLTFDQKFGSVGNRDLPGGRRSIEFQFTAKNNFGAELPQRARCVFSDRGLESADISK